jgi:hypothetical protein
MAVNKRPTFGGIFFRGHISLKNRTYCPLLATIQALSKTRVFLLSKKSKDCFVWAEHSLLISPCLLFTEGGFPLVPVLIWKYITLDGQTLCPRTDGDASFNASYRVKYPFFAPILAVFRAQAITNPIRQWSSSCYSAYHWLIGLLIARARHTAKIGAKSLIGQKKTILITAHLCSETAV